MCINFVLLSGSCERGKALVCDSYHIDKDILNGTETCRNIDDSCFVLWGEETNERNETLHRVIKKGCFQLDRCKDIQNASDCIQNANNDAFKSENVSGFCCCNTDMCNVNFTAVDYEEYELTVIVPTTMRGKYFQNSLTDLPIVIWLAQLIGTRLHSRRSWVRIPAKQLDVGS